MQDKEVLKEEEQITEQISPTSLAYALPTGWLHLISEGELKPYRHIAFIEDQFLRLYNGEINRLIVSLPTQQGKSMLCSRAITSWILGHRPNDRIILVSYNSEFACTWGRSSRDALENYGPQVFNVGVNPDIHSVKDWGTYDIVRDKPFNGGMKSMGLDTLAGKPADWLIIDDYIKGKEQALSDAERRKAVEWWQADAQARITPKTKVMIIASRWAADDLIGYLLEKQERGGEHWEYVCLSEIAEEDDPMGREVGEPLWPEERPLDWCLQKKEDMGTYWWRCNRQGKPVVRGGNVLKTSWLRRYSERPKREDADAIYLSVDTAQKKEEISDYSVISVFYVIEENKYYLVDVLRDKFEHPELISTVCDVAGLWRPNGIIIEDKGSGTSLIHHLEQETEFAPIPVNPRVDKEMRAINESHVIKTGHLYVPLEGTAEWLYEWELEYETFPASNKKDQVDSLVQFLWFMRNEYHNRIELF